MLTSRVSLDAFPWTRVSWVFLQVAQEKQCEEETAGRRELLARLKDDMEVLGKSIGAERRTAKRLAQDQAAAAGGTSDGMPQVLDYVAQKAEMFDLASVLKTWEKKVAIMEMAAKRVRSLKRSQREQQRQGTMGR